MSSTTPSIVRSHSHEHEIDESSSATDSMHCRELSDISINKAAKSTPQPISSKEKTSKADPETDPRTWLCLCEHGILSLCDETPECMCMRYLENNPGHLYTFTKRGDTLYRSWRCDAIERDPDTWGVFTRKDFGKSGMVEAVENMICAFDRVWNWEVQDTWVIWAHVEGIARFFSQHDDDLYRLGDTESSAKLVMLIADSEIQNIGFVIRLLLGAVVDFGVICRANEDGWRFVVKKKTKDHGITIRGFGRLATVRDQNLENMDEAPNFVEAYQSPPNPTASAPSVERSWGAWDWKQEFVAYSNVYGVDGKIGGNRYDLSEPDIRDAVAAAIDSSRTSTDSEPPVGVPD